MSRRTGAGRAPPAVLENGRDEHRGAAREESRGIGTHGAEAKGGYIDTLLCPAPAQHPHLSHNKTAYKARASTGAIAPQVLIRAVGMPEASSQMA